jgi:hypothetical protein
MALKITKTKGEPEFKFRLGGLNYSMRFMNVSRERENKWNKILITGGPPERLAAKNPQTIVPLTLKGVPQKMMPLKQRHVLIKILKKYNKGGYFQREDIGALYKDLQLIESKVRERLELLLG